MAAEMVEMVMLNEVVDTSIDEELLLDYDNDGEIHLLAAIGAFMRRDLNRIVGFYEIVVPSYSVDEFRSHFRMTKNTFEALSRELAATGAIPTGNRFGRKPIPLQKQTGVSLVHIEHGSNQIWPRLRIKIGAGPGTGR